MAPRDGFTGSGRPARRSADWGLHGHRAHVGFDAIPESARPRAGVRASPWATSEQVDVPSVADGDHEPITAGCGFGEPMALDATSCLLIHQVGFDRWAVRDLDHEARITPQSRSDGRRCPYDSGTTNLRP